MRNSLPLLGLSIRMTLKWLMASTQRFTLKDYDLCFRFYQNGLKVVGIDKILHHWRDRSNRISRTWEEYKDNRYFDMKLRYFYEIDRDYSRPLVLWGTGRNGKDMARLLLERGDTFHWVSDSERKIGVDIYGVITEHFEDIQQLDNPQIMIVVASPDGKEEIRHHLEEWDKKTSERFIGYFA